MNAHELHIWAPILLLTCTLAIFSAITLLGYYQSTRSSRAAVKRLLLATTRRRVPASGKRTRMQGLKEQAAEYLHKVRVLIGGDNATLNDRIRQAGFRGTFALDAYVASRILGPVMALGLGSLIPSNRGFWMISMPAVAYLVPDIILQQRVRAYRTKIRLSLPDAVDLLVICVDAGLGLDQALLRVAEELVVSHKEISSELLQINNEQRAGKPRVEAWADMEKRVDLPDVHSLVNMLIQTERFGTPISRALSQFAAGLRLKRRQAAEEMAAKTTVKIIFPLVIFIFPSIFIVLLGPAVMSIMRGMSAMSSH